MTKENIIIFSTSNGTMSIYKENIYLFNKSKFVKIIKIINEDYLLRESNLQELLDYIHDHYLRLKEWKRDTYCGIKVSKILKNYEYYSFYINTLLGNRGN